jgi:excisionase family DNA binding protein
MTIVIPRDFKPKTYSISEVKRISGLGNTTIFALMANGTLTSIKIGRRRFIHADSLDRLLETGTDTTGQAA